MTGIVDVGGGMRGVYTSGVYDYLLDKDINIDLSVGVSAGSANLITYIAKQKRRTLKFYNEYPERREFMSLHNLLKTGSYIGLDYIYSTLSNSDGEDPLDFKSAAESSQRFVAATTRAKDGKGIFFSKDSLFPNDYTLLKASCCLPGVCEPVEMNGELYFDGGIAEPVPVKKAFEEGCDKVILLLTKPKVEYCTPMFATKVLAARIKKYRKVFELMHSLPQRCSDIFKECEKYEKEGRLIIIEPHDCFGMNTLTKDKEPIMKMYNQGYKDAEKIERFLG